MTTPDQLIVYPERLQPGTVVRQHTDLGGNPVTRYPDVTLTDRKKNDTGWWCDREGPDIGLADWFLSRCFDLVSTPGYPRPIVDASVLKPGTIVQRNSHLQRVVLGRRQPNLPGWEEKYHENVTLSDEYLEKNFSIFSIFSEPAEPLDPKTIVPGTVLESKKSGHKFTCTERTDGDYPGWRNGEGGFVSDTAIPIGQWVIFSTPESEPELSPSQIFRQIEDLLIDHGYPPNRVKEWWSLTNGRALTPDARWRRGEHMALLDDVRAGYEKTERAVKEDPVDFKKLDEAVARASAASRKTGADGQRLFTRREVDEWLHSEPVWEAIYGTIHQIPPSPTARHHRLIEAWKNHDQGETRA